MATMRPQYQVSDVARSVAFYTTQLGFTLEHQQLPAFASVSLGDAQLLLSGPQASGSRPMPNGRRQEPGGWNRIVLRVEDLAAFIHVLEEAGPGIRSNCSSRPDSASRSGRRISPRHSPSIGIALNKGRGEGTRNFVSRADELPRALIRQFKDEPPDDLPCCR